MTSVTCTKCGKYYDEYGDEIVKDPYRRCPACWAELEKGPKKIRLCDGPFCDQRRIHFDHPDVMRPRQKVEVPIDWPDEKLVFCSIECSMYYKGEQERKKNIRATVTQ